MTNKAECKEIELSNNQINTVLHLVVNLHWDLIRELLNDWTDLQKNPEMWSMDKIKRADKLIDDMQELESIVKGVPIK